MIDWISLSWVIFCDASYKGYGASNLSLFSNFDTEARRIRSHCLMWGSREVWEKFYAHVELTIPFTVKAATSLITISLGSAESVFLDTFFDPGPKSNNSAPILIRNLQVRRWRYGTHRKQRENLACFKVLPDRKCFRNAVQGPIK